MIYLNRCPGNLEHSSGYTYCLKLFEDSDVEKAKKDGYFLNVEDAIADAIKSGRRSSPDRPLKKRKEKIVFKVTASEKEHLELSTKMRQSGEEKQTLTFSGLMEEAKKLGLKVDGRWSVAKLKDEVEKARTGAVIE